MIRNKELFSVILVFILICVLMQICGITCPILYLTGVSCAGCGMTRAWIELFQLHLSEAVEYHPLFWVPAIWMLIWLLRDRISSGKCKRIVYLTIAALLVVYTLRIVSPSDSIVVFKPENGVLFRIFMYISSKVYILKAR